jgi:hypothetical protein
MRRLSGNAGVDARPDGRRTLAVIWLRRAIGLGSSDALLHLAKLRPTFDNRRSEYGVIGNLIRTCRKRPTLREPRDCFRIGSNDRL